MLQEIRCPCHKKDGRPCKRYLGKVDGQYSFKCPYCKGKIEGNTVEGWMKIVHPAEK